MTAMKIMRVRPPLPTPPPPPPPPVRAQPPSNKVEEKTIRQRQSQKSDRDTKKGREKERRDEQ